jgi:hypothetical protein
VDPKKQGIVFEALTFLALVKSTKKAVHWGIKPKGFDIDPDFIVGEIESPLSWIMVTSTGSAKEFDKKFWRNVAEIFAVKRAFSSPPIVINLVFKESQKLGLQSALAAICDGYINVGKDKSLQPLIDFVSDLDDNVAAKKQAKVDRLEKELRGNSTYNAAFDALVNRLKHQLTAKSAQHGQLWALVANFQSRKTDKRARVTTVRRGIGKLLLVPDSLRPTLLLAAKQGSLIRGELPDYLELSGIAEKAASGYRISDSDLAGLATSLSEGDIKYVTQNSPLGRMEKWIQPIVELGGYKEYDRYFRRNLRDLVTPLGMYTHLRAVQRDPSMGGRHGNATNNWLYAFSVDVLKAHASKSQAFGYSKLGALVKENKDKINAWLASQSLQPLSLKGKSIIVRGLTDWVNRLDTTHARSFSDSFQGAVAWVLAGELANISADDLPPVNEVVGMSVNTYLEKKIIPYRYFEPLPLLIESKLKASKISYRRMLAHQTVLGEMVSDSRIATTPVYVIGRTLVHWKSAPKNPRDKTKELCGRGVALRLAFDGKNFSSRAAAKRTCLVLDGAFTTGQLRMLEANGWDYIFYPDELDELVALLK